MTDPDAKCLIDRVADLEGELDRARAHTKLADLRSGTLTKQLEKVSKDLADALVRERNLANLSSANVRPSDSLIAEKPTSSARPKRPHASGNKQQEKRRNAIGPDMA